MFDNPRDPVRPLRIGYISGDFRAHAISMFIEPVLAGHDAERITVHCYDNAPSQDVVARRLRGPVGWGRRKTFSGEYLKPGMVIGFFLFTAFFTQAWGLVFTTASRSGFITGLSVLLVPLLAILILRQIPARSAMVGAALAFFGLYLLTSADQTQALSFNWGDFLTLICAFFWAGHILALGRYSPGGDAFWLTFIQLATSCVGSLGWVAFTGDFNLRLPPGVYGAALYLALTCTVLAYLGQTWAQARTTPTRTAISPGRPGRCA